MMYNCRIYLTHVEQIKRGMKNNISTTRYKNRQVDFWISSVSGSQIFVAGTFNNWNPKTNQMHEQCCKGFFKTALFVSCGIHEYKFIANGIWMPDPSCHSRILNTYGSENSVIHIL